MIRSQDVDINGSTWQGNHLCKKDGQEISLVFNKPPNGVSSITFYCISLSYRRRSTSRMKILILSLALLGYAIAFKPLGSRVPRLPALSKLDLVLRTSEEHSIANLIAYGQGPVSRELRRQLSHPNSPLGAELKKTLLQLNHKFHHGKILEFDHGLDIILGLSYLENVKRLRQPKSDQDRSVGITLTMLHHQAAPASDEPATVLPVYPSPHSPFLTKLPVEPSELPASSQSPLEPASSVAPSESSSEAPVPASSAAPSELPSEVPVPASSEAPLVASSAAPSVVSSAESLVASSAAPLVASSAEPSVASSEAPLVASSEAPLVASSAEPSVASSKAPLLSSSANPLPPSSEAPASSAAPSSSQAPTEPSVATHSTRAPLTPAPLDELDEYLVRVPYLVRSFELLRHHSNQLIRAAFLKVLVNGGRAEDEEKLAFLLIKRGVRSLERARLLNRVPQIE
uniref:DUF1758 domain-containing protein n=1 Tax=Panagrellus redivivus TaxID=6233 RepID=A0A7E4ZWN6_PANRE